MRRSATCNHGNSSAVMPFKDAARAVCRAWRKKYRGSPPPPPLSHALSSYSDNTWRVVSAESGSAVATVGSDMSVQLEPANDD